MEKKEKRKHRRKEIFAKIDVQLNREKTVKALMYNISQGGVNFKIYDKVVHGDHCKIGIGNDNKMYWFDGYIKVIQSIEERKDAVKSGVEFVKEMEEHEFNELVAFLSKFGFN